MGAPPLEPVAPLPGTPPELPGDDEGAQSSQMGGAPPWYIYIHTPLPSAQFFGHDAYAKDRKRDQDFNPDLLTDEGTSTD